MPATISSKTASIISTIMSTSMPSRMYTIMPSCLILILSTVTSGFEIGLALELYNFPLRPNPFFAKILSGVFKTDGQEDEDLTGYGSCASPLSIGNLDCKVEPMCEGTGYIDCSGGCPGEESEFNTFQIIMEDKEKLKKDYPLIAKIAEQDKKKNGTGKGMKELLESLNVKACTNFSNETQALLSLADGLGGGGIGGEESAIQKVDDEATSGFGGVSYDYSDYDDDEEEDDEDEEDEGEEYSLEDEDDQKVKDQQMEDMKDETESEKNMDGGEEGNTETRINSEENIPDAVDMEEDSEMKKEIQARSLKKDLEEENTTPESITKALVTRSAIDDDTITTTTTPESITKALVTRRAIDDDTPIKKRSKKEIKQKAYSKKRSLTEEKENKVDQNVIREADLEKPKNSKYLLSKQQKEKSEFLSEEERMRVPNVSGADNFSNDSLFEEEVEKDDGKATVNNISTTQIKVRQARHADDSEDFINELKDMAREAIRILNQEEEALKETIKKGHSSTHNKYKRRTSRDLRWANGNVKKMELLDRVMNHIQRLSLRRRRALEEGLQEDLTEKANEKLEKEEEKSPKCVVKNMTCVKFPRLEDCSGLMVGKCGSSLSYLSILVSPHGVMVTVVIISLLVIAAVSASYYV